MLDAIKKAQRVINKYNKNVRDNKAAFEAAAKKYGYITLPDGSKGVPINHSFAEDKEEYEKIVKLQKELPED